MDNRVYAVKCPDYSQAAEKMALLLNMLGGMGAFARSGEKIALKVNLLLAARPEQANITDAVVVAHAAGDHVGDRFETAMRMIGEAADVVVLAHIHAIFAQDGVGRHEVEVKIGHEVFGRVFEARQRFAVPKRCMVPRMIVGIATQNIKDEPREQLFQRMLRIGKTVADNFG